MEAGRTFLTTAYTHLVPDFFTNFPTFVPTVGSCSNHVAPNHHAAITFLF